MDRIQAAKTLGVDLDTALTDVQGEYAGRTQALARSDRPESERAASQQLLDQALAVFVNEPHYTPEPAPEPEPEPEPEPVAVTFPAPQYGPPANRVPWELAPVGGQSHPQQAFLNGLNTDAVIGTALSDHHAALTNHLEAWARQRVDTWLFHGVDIGDNLRVPYVLVRGRAYVTVQTTPVPAGPLNRVSATPLICADSTGAFVPGLRPGSSAAVANTLRSEGLTGFDPLGVTVAIPPTGQTSHYTLYGNAAPYLASESEHAFALYIATLTDTTTGIVDTALPADIQPPEVDLLRFFTDRAHYG